MADQYACYIAFAPDSGVPTPALLARLSSLERDLVMHLPTEQQRRQSTLARLAGKSAIERPLGRRASRSSRVEILKAANGEPVALVDGNAGVASVSLAHSSRLAVACAWTNLPRNGYGAGVDLERVRHSEVASSPYAFSRRERRLISAASQGTSWIGLAAWTAKEATWKAMRPEVECGPETIEICELDLRQGRAALRPRGKLVARFHQATFRARLNVIPGPDGMYLLTIAEVVSRSRG